MRMHSPGESIPSSNSLRLTDFRWAYIILYTKYGGRSNSGFFFSGATPEHERDGFFMKKYFTITRKRMVMAVIIAAVPTTVFAAQSGSGSAVKYILYAGIAAAFIIDMWHESKRRK